MKIVCVVTFFLSSLLANAQDLSGKVGMATEVIQKISLKNVEDVFKDYDYIFGGDIDSPYTKAFSIDRDGGKLKSEDILVCYFDKDTKSTQAIVLILTKKEYSLTIKELKKQNYQSEAMTIMGNYGLRWTKKKSAFRYFSDAEHKTISVFYIP